MAINVWRERMPREFDVECLAVLLLLLDDITACISLICNLMEDFLYTERMMANVVRD